MSRPTYPNGSQTGTCRLCSQPITQKGKCGWYHSGLNLGVVHGIRAHFAEPAVRAVA